MLAASVSPRESAGRGPSAIRQLAKRAMTALLPRRLFITCGPAASRSVCLTFDDGPHPEHTPALLELLAAHGVRASFFVIGQRARAHPELIRAIAAAGHDVGHHSFTHSPPGQVSALGLAGEVRQTRRLLTELTGRAPLLFRPPLGKLTPAKLLALWAARQAIVLWNVDPKDFSAPSAEPVREFLATRPLQAGDIVLLHDAHPHAAAVLPELIAATRKRGLEFTPASQWVL